MAFTFDIGHRPDDAEAAFRNLHREMTGRLEDFQRQAEASLSHWQGSSKMEYSRVKVEWHLTAGQRAEKLEPIAIALRQITELMRTNEVQNTAMWAGQ